MRIWVEYIDTGDSALLEVSDTFDIDNDAQEPFCGVCVDTGETLKVARPWDCEIAVQQ